jgi:hypothetical protein
MYVGDVMDLASSSQVGDRASAIQAIFEWRRQRLTMICRGLIGFAASLVLALLIDLLRHDTTASAGAVIVVVFSAVEIVIVTGSILAIGLEKLEREFLAALRMHDALINSEEP